MPGDQNTADWLEVIRIGKKDWRVSDTRRDAGDPARLLGFIERIRRDRYEVLWMTAPLRWAYLPSMSEAIEAFGDSLRFTGEQVPDRQESTRRRRGPPRSENIPME